MTLTPIPTRAVVSGGAEQAAAKTKKTTDAELAPNDHRELSRNEVLCHPRHGGVHPRVHVRTSALRECAGKCFWLSQVDALWASSGGRIELVKRQLFVLMTALRNGKVETEDKVRLQVRG